MIPHIITPTSITVVIDNVHRCIDKSHVNFERLARSLRELNLWAQGTGEYADVVENIRDLVDIRRFVARVTEGRVQISDDTVMFDGKKVHGVIADNLLRLLNDGMDVRPLARFLERVSQNPIISARDEIYLFLESGNMVLTDDGCFLAFKKVKADFSSSHTDKNGNKVYNHIGTVVSMPIDECDTNRSETCSSGLHFCSFQYLPSFGVGGESRVVVLKIAPEDVVAIPNDYNNSKGRAWKYAVIGEVPESECEHVFSNVSVVTAYGVYVSDDHEYEDGTYDDCEWNRGCDDSGCDICNPQTYATDDDEVMSYPVEPWRTLTWQEITFSHKGVSITGENLVAAVTAFGQRGYSRATGIPRSTVQGWLAKLVENGYPGK